MQDHIISRRISFLCEDKNVDLHMYYTLNMAAVNHFGTQIPEIEEIDEQMKTELDSHGKN